MIRLGMSSPIWIDERLNEYLEILQHPKMFQFLHVPIQSGSDRILRAMRREGDAAQFLRIAESLHARLPDATLMTDIIAGYPGEEDEDFAATLELLARAAPAAVNRSRFSPRPGTPAAQLKPPPGRAVAERAAALNDLARRLARDFHQRWVGRRDRVLTAEAPRPGSVVAHNRSWRPVDLAGGWPLGAWVEVVYHAAADYHLQARAVEAPSPIQNQSSRP
jgi:tRNA A37 methylthiotransferase MiaB